MFCLEERFDGVSFHTLELVLLCLDKEHVAKFGVEGGAASVRGWLAGEEMFCDSKLLSFSSHAQQNAFKS